jgi:hypothetical protein
VYRGILSKLLERPVRRLGQPDPAFGEVGTRKEMQGRENKLGEMKCPRVLRVDVAHNRKGEATGGNAREELGGGGMPGALRVVLRRGPTIAQKRGLVNIAVILLAPQRV